MTSPHRFAETLTPRQRKRLRGLAHALKPSVQIGHLGLTDQVKAAVLAAAETHELIKVQLSGSTNASEKQEQEDLLRSGLGPRIHLVARVGRIAVIYLEKDSEKAKLPLKGLVSRASESLDLDDGQRVRPSPGSRPRSGAPQQPGLRPSPRAPQFP
jgi:RNA-binding protein